MPQSKDNIDLYRADSESTPVAAKRSRGILLLLVSVGVVAAFQVGKAPPALPAMRIDLGMSLFAASWVISIFSLIGASSGIIVGALGDWLGYRRLTLFGLFCMMVGSLAGAMSPGTGILLSTRVIEGFGFLFIATAAPALIVRVTQPHDLRLALGVWGGYLPAGAAIMMVFSPLLISLFGWRGLWLISALISVPWLVLLARATRHVHEKPSAMGRVSATLWRNIKKTCSHPGPLLLAAAFATYTLQWMTLMGFLPTFFIEKLGMSQDRAAILTAVSMIVNIIGNLAGGWLLHRNCSRWILIALTSAVMSLSTLGIYSDAMPNFLRYLLCIGFSTVGGIIPASVFAGAPVHAPSPDLVGTTNGLIMQGSNLGQVIGPPVLAVVVTATGGWQDVPWIFLICGCLGVLLALGIRRLERCQKILS